MVIGRARYPITETRTVAPILAWTCRRVLVPRAVSRLDRGRRPVTGAGTNESPPGAGSAIASAVTPPTSSGAPVQAVVHAATWRSPRIGASAGSSGSPAPLLTMASHVTPYR